LLQSGHSNVPLMSGNSGALFPKYPGLPLRLDRDDLDRRIVLGPWRSDIVQWCLSDLSCGALMDIFEDVVLRVPHRVLARGELKYL